MQIAQSLQMKAAVRRVWFYNRGEGQHLNDVQHERASLQLSRFKVSKFQCGAG